MKPDRPLRWLELFAGAGGAALGLHAAGAQHVALVERDASACATLRAAGLGPVVEGDVRDLDAIEAVAGPIVDAIWSSFPCQCFSQAGKREGAADARNGWPWTVAAIDRFRPRWLLAENVAGLAHHRAGCGFRGGQEGLFEAADPMSCPGCYLERVILPEMRERFAYAGVWEIDCADLGVPQRRTRLILWAGPVALEMPPLTHGAGRLPWVTMGEALGLGDNEQPMTSLGTFGQELEDVEVHGPAGAVTCQIAKQSQPWKAVGLPWVAVKTGNHAGGRQMLPVDGPAPTITASYGQRGRTPWTSAGNPWLTRPSPAVTAVGELKGSGPGGSPEKLQRASDALYLGTGRRRLTWQECAILQAFPADHPFQGPISARYSQVGNAAPPPLAAAAVRQVLEAAHEA